MPNESVAFENGIGSGTTLITVPTTNMGNLLISAVTSGGGDANITSAFGAPPVPGSDVGFVQTQGSVSYLSIRQENGAEFTALQIDVFETGNWNDTDTIVYAYKDGALLGSVNAGVALDNNTLFSFDLSLHSIFAEVDEIRISRPNGSTGATVQIDKLIISGSLNSAPTGTVTVTGIAEVGAVLTAENTLADADGMGVVTYQWNADDVAIDGATSATFTVTEELLGKKITVTASYVDGADKDESVTSEPTDAIIEANNAPVISGIPGSALTIAPGEEISWPSITINDVDGDTLTVTIAATGVTIAGLVDEDSSQEGIQITGVASHINLLLAGATFNATHSGSASITITVDDGRVADPIIGSVSLNVKTPGSGGGSKPEPQPEPEPNIVHTDESGRAVDTDEAETFVGEDDAIDAVTFSGSRADYTIIRNEDGSFTIKGSGEADTLQSIERLHFDDGVLALDIEDGPGIAFRLYQAAFGREADEAGLGFWIERLDDGEIDLLGLAQSFIQSDEFESLYGSGVIENLSFIELLYENILGRGSEDEGFAFWQQALEDGATFDWLLAVFSESAENVENIAPLIADGIWYQL